MNRYADFFVRRRGVVLLFVFLVTVVTGYGVARIEFDDLPRGVIRSEDATFELLEELYDQFGSDDNDIVLVLERDDWFTPEGVEILQEAQRRAHEVENVERVNGLAGVVDFTAGLLPRALLPTPQASKEAFEDSRARAHAHPLVGGTLLSTDGGTALVVIRLAGGELTIEDIEPSLDAIQTIAGELSTREGVRARVTGVPAFRAVIFNVIRRDQILFMSLGAVVCFLVALVLFRSWRACLITTVPAALGSFWVLGVIGLFGGSIDLLGSVLPVLCILIAFTDSVHLTIDIRHEIAQGRTRSEAVHHAIRMLGIPCFLTSITTSIGLGSLALGSVPMIRNFGFQAMFAVLIVFVAVLTTLPLAATMLDVPGRAISKGARSWGRLVDCVTARPRLIGTMGLLVTLGLILTCLRLVPENRLSESIPQGNEAYKALLHCEGAFGGLLPLYVMVEWEEGVELKSRGVLEALAEVEALLVAEEDLSRPISALGLLELIPGPEPGRLALLGSLPSELLKRFVRDDLRRTIVVSRLPDFGQDRMRPMIARIDDGLVAIEAEHPELKLRLTGTDVVARRNINRMITDLARGLAVAAFLIFGIIALEFRSLRLGLLSLLPNVFPLAAVGALLVVLGYPLQIASAVLFTVLLGLAVDDTIHFLVRYRQERKEGEDVRLALRRTGIAVGTAVMTTTIVLVAGYSVVFTSSVPTNRLFATLISVGLAAALVGDLLILPALLAWFRRR